LNLEAVHNIYFIGIGGIGMSAIAKYFKQQGKNVAGYDRVATQLTQTLQEMGISINFSDAVEEIPAEYLTKNNTLVVYTPAIPKNHNQLNFFKNNQFLLHKRSEILGEITKSSFCLAVAGTHGKTTTSAILGHILHENDTQVTAFLGGIAENYNSNLILGKSNITVVEADEFDKSFLQLTPKIACITSMDADHLDIYGEPAALENAFKEFAAKVSQTVFVRNGLPIAGKTFGINDNSDYRAENIRIENGKYIFDVKTPTEHIENIRINLPGKHNVLNTVAALAMANEFGISLQAIAKALLTFKGIKRRFSYVINTKNLVLIDDYAHHPSEINAVVQSVRELYPNREVLGIFQPHLYSRTLDFADDFAKSLSQFDQVVLLDIYPARELPIEGVNSQWLLNKINNPNKQLVSKENLGDWVCKTSAQVIVMIGAGDIGEMVQEIKNKLQIES
jgi:UDP-N-acetylmuramate--alanine ligase